MYYFCTYCDQGYAVRLLSLRQSLLEQEEPFKLAVLCFDRATWTIVTSIGGEELHAIALDDFLRAHPDYAAVRAQRSQIEFYFTATPVLVRHCFDLFSTAQTITYLDSDLFFFAPPSLVFKEQGLADVGIVPHRFSERLSHLKECGVYNVGWVSFRRTPAGLSCVEWWRERCIEWCHDYVDGKRYADQGYLDEFPKRVGNICILEHPGVNLAPWNVESVRMDEVNGKVWIDSVPLIFFHFQGIRELISGWFELGLRNYGSLLTPALRDRVYLPYLKVLVGHQRDLTSRFGVPVQIGYQRLSSKQRSLIGRWKQEVMKRLLPYYRRWRGQLVHCVLPSDNRERAGVCR